MPGTRRRPGRLGAYVEGYRAHLLELGHTPSTVRGQLKQFGALGRWMAEQDIALTELDVGAINVFLEARRLLGRRRVPTQRSFNSLLDYLRGAGLITAVTVTSAPSPSDELIADYRRWMTGERRLAPGTVVRYERTARKLLAERATPGDKPDVGGLTGGDVSKFLLREVGDLSDGSAKGRVAELRSLLRFLHREGLIGMPLATAVPPVAGWHNTEIPKSMRAGDMERLLGSCDRQTIAGVRDYAILTMLARLGLRSVEVSSLELEDLDWRAGEMLVRGKSHREDRLPLPNDVGEAVVRYLEQRPPHTSRRVFLTLKAPRQPIVPAIVGEVVGRACERAGLPVLGAHRLRHALATELLRKGATLIDISQVLRHRDLATTAGYAKVDLGRLREVSQPWPGASQ